MRHEVQLRNEKLRADAERNVAAEEEALKLLAMAEVALLIRKNRIKHGRIFSPCRGCARVCFVRCCLDDDLIRPADVCTRAPRFLCCEYDVLPPSIPCLCTSLALARGARRARDLGILLSRRRCRRVGRGDGPRERQRGIGNVGRSRAHRRHDARMEARLAARPHACPRRHPTPAFASPPLPRANCPTVTHHGDGFLSLGAGLAECTKRPSAP